MKNFDAFLQGLTNKEPAKPEVKSAEPSMLKGKPVNYATLHEAYADRRWNLGEEKVVMGNMDADGYKVICENLRGPGKGQDAFGISPDRKTYCVADGMGGEGAHSGNIARYLSAELSKDDSSWMTAFTPGGLESLVATFIDNWKAAHPGEDASQLSGHTTLSMWRLNPDGSAYILQLGDSPVYIKKKDGSLIAVGNSSANDLDTGVHLGVTNGVATFDFDLKANLYKADDVESIVGATDWFSDNYESVCLEANQATVADLESRYPQLKTGLTTNIHYNIVNKYQMAKARIAGGSKSFNPLFFKDVADEAEIDSKMTKVYTTKPDDKVIVMVDVEQVLRQNQ